MTGRVGSESTEGVQYSVGEGEDLFLIQAEIKMLNMHHQIPINISISLLIDSKVINILEHGCIY